MNLYTILQNMTDISIDNTKYVAPWRQTKYICFSSLFFMALSLYGYSKKQYLLANVALATSLCSVNFWRDANYSYRRTADVIMAKCSFVIYLMHGVKYVTWKPFVISGYSSLGCLLYCYYMSNKHGNSEKWWKYHMMFHFFISYAQWITIKSMEYSLHTL